MNGFSLLPDFGDRLDRDSRKSQSANREENDCQSKFHWNVTCVWFIVSHCLSILHHLCSVLVSSTDGGLWTQMMRMITNFKRKPWNEPRHQEKIYITGTLITSLTIWILGFHTSFSVSLETTYQEGRTTKGSWHWGISGVGGGRIHTVSFCNFFFNEVATNVHCVCYTPDSSWHCLTPLVSLSSYSFLSLFSSLLTSVLQTQEARQNAKRGAADAFLSRWFCEYNTLFSIQDQYPIRFGSCTWIFSFCWHVS